MKLTIIYDDKTVYKDGKSFVGINMSTVPSNVHALQFDDVTHTGHIEYKDGPNENIDVLPAWAVTALNNFNNAVSAYEAEQQAKFAAYKEAKGNQ